jgi:hypothetical protein
MGSEEDHPQTFVEWVLALLEERFPTPAVQMTAHAKSILRALSINCNESRQE